MPDTSDCFLCESHRTTGLPQMHRYHWTAAMQEAVALAARGKHGAVKRLWRTDPRFAAIPYHTVQRYGQAVGVAKASRRCRQWCAAEEQVLADHVGRQYSLRTWQRLLKRQGFARSFESIKARLRLRGWSNRQGEWTLPEVADGFGVNLEVVARWVREGWLRSTKAGVRNYVTTKALRQMLTATPFLAGIGTPDVTWIIAVLTEQGIGRTHEAPDQDDESGDWMTGDPVHGSAAAD